MLFEGVLLGISMMLIETPYQQYYSDNEGFHNTLLPPEMTNSNFFLRPRIEKEVLEQKKLIIVKSKP